MGAEATDESFRKEVVEKSKKTPVLVDFWAPWCPPCLMLAPIIEEAAEEFKGRVLLVKANTNDCVAASEEYSIKAIPNVKLFKKGRVCAEFIGFKQKDDIIKWLKAEL